VRTRTTKQELFRSATTAYACGISLIVGQNANNSWLFASRAFSLTPGETFPIDVTFDGQAQYHLFGTAVYAT
jgi:hypothetical protein